MSVDVTSEKSVGRQDRAVFMEEMSYAEIAEAVDKGKTTAIVPMGSVEAHGPHLPINTDSVVARYLAGEIARRVAHVLVAPTVPFGYAPRTCFPGTISVRPQTILTILSDYCTSLEGQGFEEVVFLPMHAESFQMLALFAPTLAQEFPRLRVIPSLDVAALLAARNEVLDDYGVTAEEAGWHAGAAETAEMLAIDETAVRREHATRGYLGPSGFGRILPETLTAGWAVLNREGVMGDPTKATAEMGRSIFDALTAYFVQVIETNHLRSVARDA